MIYNLVIRQACSLMIIAASVVGIPLLNAQTIPIHMHTDRQLLEAGWSEKQIADMRASAPQEETPVLTEEQPVKPPALLEYNSVFEHYKSFEDIPDTDWLEANENVGRIGGWRSYARQVQAEQKKEAMELDRAQQIDEEKQ